MKKYINFILLILLLSIITCGFTGCVYGEDYYDPREELTVFDGRNFSYYQYSEKVVVKIKYGTENSDRLALATTDAKTDDSWITYSKDILTGRFKKIGWNDFKLFILMDDNYYVLDIKAYKVPSENEKDNLQYDLKKLTESELVKQFPDYETYDWFDVHN